MYDDRHVDGIGSGREKGWLVGIVAAVACLTPVLARAQDTPTSVWSWSADGNVFIGYNYQLRQFTDVSAVESQNWLMGSGDRPLGNGRLILRTMISLEPFTIPKDGSPQLFQTGESYQGVPLVNHQHPHDLLMELGATYRWIRPEATYVFGADLVGDPTLGPPVFMHRDSARDNPQVPITHHFMDSTHISMGVVRAGVEARGITIEGSVFRGAEPDENRLNIEQPRLDSWAARVGYRRGPWSAQVSGGYLKVPEWFEPYNETRLTASIGYDGMIGSRAFAATLAWGQNREEVVTNGTSNGFLLEWDLQAARKLIFYGRAEITDKQLFGLGAHPAGFQHPHIYSHFDVLTLGGIHDFLTARWARIGVGGDVTLYHMSPDMLPFFEGSRSFHVFARWRPNSGHASHVH
jgi:hypothetical protein